MRLRNSWEVIEQRIIAETGRTYAVIDSTGVGDPIVERLQHQGTYVGIKINSTNKQQMIEGLIVSIQRGEITIPDGVLRSELEAFEYEYTSFGISYRAGPGAHDDSVIAIALAVSAVRQKPGQGIW